MTLKLQPHLGRQVIYTPPEADISTVHEQHTATICKVLSSGLVNLRVINAFGICYPVTNCMLLQPGDDVPSHFIGYARWPQLTD